MTGGKLEQNKQENEEKQMKAKSNCYALPSLTSHNLVHSGVYH